MGVQGVDIEHLTSLLQSGAPMPPDIAHALQMISRGQHASLVRSPQASVPLSPSDGPSAGTAVVAGTPGAAQSHR